MDSSWRRRSGVCMAELMLEGESKLVDISTLRMGRFSEGEMNTTQYNFKVIA